MKSPKFSYYYASEIIGDKFVEGEQSIMKSPEYYYYYCLRCNRR